ncbi:MAG: hypothetical protein ACJ71Q_14350 [Terriglobales bacterium]|jgi:hypothetical protein
MNASANNGAINLQLSGDCGGANANLILDFWPFGTPSTGQPIQVGTFTANADDTSKTSFQFPQKGTFAGLFEVYVQLTGGPGPCLSSGPNRNGAGVSYSAPLLAASSITGGIFAPTGTASGSGTVNVMGNTASVSLTHAAAAQNLTVNICGPTIEHCTALGTLTTDLQGNASGQFSTTGASLGGSVVLTDSAGTEYISGFHVQ